MRKAFEDIKRITLRQKYYRVVLVSKLGSEDNPALGDCSDPNKKGKVIRYFCGMKGETRLDVIIHEMLHACFWDVAEEGVEESACDIAKILWNLGYHMSDEEPSTKASPAPKHINLRGKRYRYTRVAGLPTGIEGSVSNPNSKNKAIEIRTSLKGEKNLRALLKYMLYACFWDFDADAIEETSKDIARALIRMGYSQSVH